MAEQPEEKEAPPAVEATWKTVCRLNELAEGEGKTVVVQGRLIALFRVGAVCHAVDDTCPHMGASLSGGYVEDGVVTCPWHAWRFRLADGAWADNLRSRIRLGCYAVRIVGDEVQIRV